MNAISLDAISNFEEPLLERSFLFGMMKFHDSLEAREVLIKAKRTVFNSESRVHIFETILSLTERFIAPTLETVATEARKRGKEIENEFMEIFKVDPTPNLLFILNRLNQLSKDKRVFMRLFEECRAMTENKTSEMVLQELGDFVDTEISDAVEDVKTYREVKAEVLAMKPQPKYQTGVPAIDRLLDGGLELGQLIVLLGDPDAGKTMLMLQMLRTFADGSKVDCKAGAFPFEFSKENFTRNLIENNRDELFNHDDLLLNDEALDIHQLKASMITMIRRGAKFIGVDSQMMIEDTLHKGSLEAFETAKFKMLMSIAKRYNVIVAVIAQRAKDSKKGEIFGSKLAGHIAHIIFDMTLPDPDDKLHPTLKLHKNKQNGVTNKEIPLKLNRSQLKYYFVDKGKEGKVGKKSNDGNDALENKSRRNYPVVIQDENGNTLDMSFMGD
ncbi:hypothetical protein MNB_SV-13-399 [hydrothermal vent metagenome]|uniref:DNA helicase n=1 Tax=hydrothermal vent metagenome TaxID=652676 RepID=A0A1W1D036_9ZZZZ